jgi:hypothetical protein
VLIVGRVPLLASYLPPGEYLQAIHAGLHHPQVLLDALPQVPAEPDLRHERTLAAAVVKRDSSVTTGTAAVGLQPNHVRAVEWWQYPSFGSNVDRAAAELVAFDVLELALRSRGGINREARERAADPAFRAEMVPLFKGPPSGRLALPSFAELVERVEELQHRLDRLELGRKAGEP